MVNNGDYVSFQLLVVPKGKGLYTTQELKTLSYMQEADGNSSTIKLSSITREKVESTIKHKLSISHPRPCTMGSDPPTLML